LSKKSNRKYAPTPRRVSGAKPAAASTNAAARPQTPSTLSTRQLLIAAVILCAVVGVAAFLFLTANLNATGRDTPVMPLDDAYIHFQYARVMAESHPFSYNPEQPKTSGATSLLYPPLLAIGYMIGFQGERLAWWALILGGLSWIGSTWLVYRISASNGGPYAQWIGIAIAGAFALHGSLGWAFMSGMETGLMIFLCLLTFWNITRGDLRNAMIVGAITALMRPEGAAVGILAALYLAVQRAMRAKSWSGVYRDMPLYILPIVAAGVQPLLNLVNTGSLTASGMIAKSLFYNVPPDTGVAISATISNVARIFQELITGISNVDGEYRTTILTLAAILTLCFGVLNAFRYRRLNSAVLVLGWILALALLVATLETAFWQFKRYQMPIIALMYPLAAWPVVALTRPNQRNRTSNPVIGGPGVVGLIALVAVALLFNDSIRALGDFTRYYGDNAREVNASQIAMAHWAEQNLPTDAVVGVHDIGVMRYLGNRTTFDVVGLTTPGEARAWRNGPGAVFEQMAQNPDGSPYRPAYFAIYNDARGLTYFQDTGLFRQELAKFPSTAPTRNVASATSSGQFVYKADWSLIRTDPQQVQLKSDALAGLTRVDSLNVANLADEDAHQYRWWQSVSRAGFPTEVRELDYVTCASGATCKTLDGGRLITGGEEMTIRTQAGQALLWITRVHAGNASSLTLYVNGQRATTQAVPSIPGRWVELQTLIPAGMITGSSTVLRVEANISDPAVGFYMPYYHWFYQGTYQANTRGSLPGPAATFASSLQLSGRKINYDATAREISVAAEWQRVGEAPATDGVIFVHVYDPVGKLIETPGAQADQRVSGVLPPASWLPGIYRELYTLKLPTNLTPGVYRIAIGIYDPATMKRFPVSGDGADSEQRLFIGEVNIE